MTIRRHVPSFVDGVEATEASFQSLAELEQIEWIRRWLDDPDFYRFSQGNGVLMAEVEQGRKWYVVGYIDQPIAGLPIRGHP